jgi:excisionase family DNA binding protein
MFPKVKSKTMQSDGKRELLARDVPYPTVRSERRNTPDDNGQFFKIEGETKTMPSPTSSIQPMLYTVTQVAKLIGFSRTKTYQLVQRRRIPSIVVEGKIRVLRSALLAWIAQHAQATEAARAGNSL